MTQGYGRHYGARHGSRLTEKIERDEHRWMVQNALDSIPHRLSSPMRQMTDTIKGQFRSGDIDGAERGLAKFFERYADTHAITITRCANCGAYINTPRGKSYYRYVCPVCRSTR